MMRCVRGNAYIFVLIITMSVFSMLTTVLMTTNYGIKVSAAYSDRLNIYGMAESGAVQAENILNTYLLESYGEIFKEALTEAFDNISEQTVEYRMDGSGSPYTGEFHLKLPNSGSQRGDSDALFKKIFLDNASEKIPEAIGADGYTYKISLTEKSGAEKSSYTVTILPDSNSPQQITSHAVLEDSEISALVSAEIRLDYGDNPRSEILRPEFVWLDPPNWTAAGASAAGEIIFEGSGISGTTRQSASDILTDTSVFLPAAFWKPENPLAVVSGGSLDISGFYTGDEPVYTAVISESPSELILFTSDNMKDTFRGIVFSRGDMRLHEISTQGNILSHGNITVVNPYGVSVIKEVPDALLKINFSDDALRYRLYDYFLASNFKSGANDLRPLLDRLTLSKGGVLLVSDLGAGLGFRLESLREVRK